uniref:Nef-associated protein 1 n=1 Tax=Lygus hesperus TaxID=30085 RepID=A0A0A9XA89_LYGHE
MGYSHIWVIFGFHRNTNITSSIKAKITPPRLGIRVGIYATRTPHRFSNLGLSLVKIESISANSRQLTVLGADLLHATPIYDIKPYIPAYDSIPCALVPSWVSAQQPAFTSVIWSPGIKEQIHRYLCDEQLTFYKPTDEVLLLQTIEDLVTKQVRE